MVEKTHLKEGEVVNEVNNEYDIGNRLIRSNDKSFDYDKDGNQIQAGDPSFDHMTSHVNGNNVKRLKTVHENTDHVASYSYTFEGLRTGKYLDEGESEISYHYSGKNVQYEKWGNGRKVRYTHPSTCSSSCSSCGGCGNEKNVFTDHPISIEIDGNKYYYLYNGQGSVTELINSDEEVVNQYRYTPFGSPRLKAETVYNPYQYTGRRLDEETGQYYYRARMYSADQSRFTTQDPAGMQEGPNMYAYVGNNPTNKRDPTGLVAPMADIDGGGSGGDGDTCPDTTFYSSWDQCMNERDNFDECADLCFGEEGSGGSGGVPNPFAGSDCDTSVHFWGTKIKCNKEASAWISVVAGIISLGSMASSLGISTPISIAVGLLGVAAGICSASDMGLVIRQPYTGSPITWCY
ncbi:MAG: RHS repeat-associated core domain-containing protein [Thermoplasmatota archaeon]